MSELLHLLHQRARGVGRGERLEQLWSPGVQGAGQPPPLGHVGAGEAVQDAPEPVAGEGRSVAAPVEQLQLLADDPRFGELTAAVTANEGVLQPGPLPLGQGSEVEAQQPAGAVERVFTVPAPPSVSCCRRRRTSSTAAEPRRTTGRHRAPALRAAS